MPEAATTAPATSRRVYNFERYRRVDHDTLQIALTIDDPKAYTRTWGMTKTCKLKPWDICVAANEKNFEQGIVKPASSAPSK
jgi:hypothetical protein